MYLTAIASLAVVFGLAVDQIYAMAGISPRAVMGQAAEFVPLSAKYLAAFLLLVISIKPLTAWFKARIKKTDAHDHHDRAHPKEDETQTPAGDPPICTGIT